MNRKSKSIDEILEKDLRDFFFKETDIFNKRGMGENLVCLLIYSLTAKRGDKFRVFRRFVRPLEKVKDLYTLPQEKIYLVRKAGKITWQRVNSYLEKRGLPPLPLGEEYS